MTEEKHCNHHFIVPRRGLKGIGGKLGTQPLVTVAFLGGSITEGAGASEADTHSWRALTGEYLQERFPDQAFRLINAGVGGTNSTLGAHRLQEHVLQHGEIDLLFVEFSVNDNESDREESIRGMEGIVRQMRRLSPGTDLCFLYTAAEKNLSGSNPFNIAVHEEVAEHYGVASVNFAGRVYKETTAGRMEWTKLAPDGYHPNDDGHALYAAYLREYLDTELIPGTASVQSSDILSLPPLEEHNYEYGSLLHFREGHGEGFGLRKLATEDPLMNWRFDTEHLYTDSLEAVYTFTVTGQQAGVLLLYGPDSGIFEYAVNDSPYTAVNLFDEWCPMAFRPIIAMFPVQERRQEMTVKVRITGRKDEQSQGTSLRIMKILCS